MSHSAPQAAVLALIVHDTLNGPEATGDKQQLGKGARHRPHLPEAPEHTERLLGFSVPAPGAVFVVDAPAPQRVEVRAHERAGAVQVPRQLVEFGPGPGKHVRRSGCQRRHDRLRPMGCDVSTLGHGRLWRRRVVIVDDPDVRAALTDGPAREEMLAARELLTRMPGVYAFSDRIGHDDDGVLHLSRGADDTDDTEPVALCGAQLTGRFVDRGTWLEADEDDGGERCAACARRADEIPEAQEDSLAPLPADARARIRDLVDQTIEHSLDEAASRDDVGVRYPAERDAFRRELLADALTDYSGRNGAASLPSLLDQLVWAKLAKKYVAHWEQLDGASVFDPDDLVADVLSGQLQWLDETELGRYAYLTVCQRSGSVAPGPLKLAHNRVWRLPNTRR